MPNYSLPFRATLLLVAAVMFSQGPRAEAAQPVAIMPLGDSITRGSMGHPQYHPGGYRTQLFRQLRAEGFFVDFVGSQQTNPNPKHLPDADHEGHKGFRIDQIDREIVGWLDDAKPDVVLLLIGANDVNQNHDLRRAPERLETLIRKITAHASAPRLIVAQIPGSTDRVKDARIVEYNRAIPVIVARQRAAGGKVTTVDLYGVVAHPDDFANFLHPNAAGYDHIADAWFKAIAELNLVGDQP